MIITNGTEYFISHQEGELSLWVKCDQQGVFSLIPYSGRPWQGAVCNLIFTNTGTMPVGFIEYGNVMPTTPAVPVPTTPTTPVDICSLVIDYDNSRFQAFNESGNTRFRIFASGGAGNIIQFKYLSGGSWVDANIGVDGLEITVTNAGICHDFWIRLKGCVTEKYGCYTDFAVTPT